jgi:hypothetical protein
LNKKIGLLAFILAQMFILVSCASTKLVNPWRDTGYQGPVKKVFVVAVVKDRMRRSLIEKEFVLQFRARGVEAVASTELLTEVEMPKRETIEPKVLEQGADAVFVVKFIRRETVDSYTPQRDSGVPLNFTANNDALFQFPVENERSIAYDYNIAFMQLTLYNAESKKPIWASMTETKYEGNAIKQIKPFVSFVVNKLAEGKIIH